MKQVGQYTFLKKIGKGHYAQVYQAVSQDNQRLLAVKCLQREGISNNQLKNIENEVLVLEKSNHQNIISMIDRMKSKNSYYLVLEYCNGGDLSSFIDLVGKLSEGVARKITSQIIEGMMHLYNLQIMHRDLKLANILLHFPQMEGKEEEITPGWLKSVNLMEIDFKIKIADLGFSKLMSNIFDLTATYCGTPINMAPEVLNRVKYNYKADVWSLGTILFEMLTGHSPYREAQNKDQLKRKHKEFTLSRGQQYKFTRYCRNFISLCLTYNQIARPSWEQLMKHEFLNPDCVNNQHSSNPYGSKESDEAKSANSEEYNQQSILVKKQQQGILDKEIDDLTNVNEFNSDKINKNQMYFSSKHHNPFSRFQSSQQSQQPIDKTVRNDSMNLRSYTSQDLMADKDFEWNVDVSSEEIDDDSGYKYKRFLPRKKKSQQIELFLSQRNMQIKTSKMSSDPKNEHNNNTGSSSDSNYQYYKSGANSGQTRSQFNSHYHGSGNIDARNKKPWLSLKIPVNCMLSQNNNASNNISLENNQTNEIDSEYCLELDDDTQQDDSIKPQKYSSFFTAESPFQVQSPFNKSNQEGLFQNSYSLSSKSQSSDTLKYNNLQNNNKNQNLTQGNHNQMKVDYKQSLFVQKKSRFYYLSKHTSFLSDGDSRNTEQIAQQPLGKYNNRNKELLVKDQNISSSGNLSDNSISDIECQIKQSSEMFTQVHKPHDGPSSFKTH